MTEILARLRDALTESILLSEPFDTATLARRLRGASSTSSAAAVVAAAAAPIEVLAVLAEAALCGDAAALREARRRREDELLANMSPLVLHLSTKREK